MFFNFSYSLAFYLQCIDPFLTIAVVTLKTCCYRLKVQFVTDVDIVLKLCWDLRSFLELFIHLHWHNQHHFKLSNPLEKMCHLNHMRYQVQFTSITFLNYFYVTESEHWESKLSNKTTLAFMQKLQKKQVNVCSCLQCCFQELE